MNYKRCMYYVEGKCEEQLINVLKAEPRRLTPGKVKDHNIIQKEIPRREVNMIGQGTTVVFVYDTDVEKTDMLMKNIEHVMKYAAQTKIVHMAQVRNFEDEIVRSTDVKKVQDLTRSKSVSDFKTDFCRMKIQECRNALERHHLDISILWSKKPPKAFDSVKQGGDTVKLS